MHLFHRFDHYDKHLYIWGPIPAKGTYQINLTKDWLPASLGEYRYAAPRLLGIGLPIFAA
jgi:hypothetical protein